MPLFCGNQSHILYTVYLLRSDPYPIIIVTFLCEGQPQTWATCLQQLFPPFLTSGRSGPGLRAPNTGTTIVLIFCILPSMSLRCCSFLKKKKIVQWKNTLLYTSMTAHVTHIRFRLSLSVIQQGERLLHPRGFRYCCYVGVNFLAQTV